MIEGMKDTTNQFTKGLNKDLNPISMPADSMSDALNATFLTFNGNELSLQNDMGNTRLIYKYKDPVTNKEEVKKVQLHDGFVPVGIKEYGGVLYIASYNPQEGKFQMGSFPSPEFRSTDLLDEELFDEQRVEISTDNKKFDSSEQHIITSSTESSNIVLRPFDVIISYIFKDFNFETLSSKNDRRFYTYRLINTMNQQDITEHFDKSLFTNDVSYATFEVANIDSFTVTLGNGRVKIFSKENCNYSDEQLYCVKYRQKDKEVVSIYSYGQDIISIVPKSNLPNFKITIHKRKKAPLSYPNIANGQIAIVFDVEKVDFFNIIHKGDNNKNVFGPKFSVQKTEDAPPLSLDSLEGKLNTWFKIVDKGGTKDFDTYLNYREEIKESVTTYFKDEYTLQGTNVTDKSCSINVYFENGQLGTVLTLSLNEQDGEYILSEPTAPLPFAEQKQPQYHLQFEGFDIQEPSWVKVNSVEYGIKVYHHSENKPDKNTKEGVIEIKSNTIPDKDGHTRVFFDEKIDVPIPTTHPSEEQNLGKWFFKFKKQTRKKVGEDEWEDDETSTVYGYCKYLLSPTENENAEFIDEPFFTYQKPKLSRNYFCDVTFTPKNTDYFDGGLDYLSLHFRYDLSKSLQLLSGNATFVDSGIVLPYGLADGNYLWASGVGTWKQDQNTGEFTYNIRKDELRTFNKNEYYKGVYTVGKTITAPPFLQNKVFSDGIIPHNNYFKHNLKTGGSDIWALEGSLLFDKVSPVTTDPAIVNAHIPKVGGEWDQLKEEFRRIVGSNQEPFNGRKDCQIHYLYKTNSHHTILDKEAYPIYDGAKLKGTLSVKSRLNKGGASVTLTVIETELNDTSVKNTTYQYISHLGKVGEPLLSESQVTRTKNKNEGLSEQPEIPSLTVEDFTEFDIPSDRFVFVIGALNGRILNFNSKPGYRTYDNYKWAAQEAYIKFTGGISPRSKGTNILEISLNHIQFTPPPNTQHKYGQFFVKMENGNQYYLDPYGRNLPIEVKPINKYGNDSDSPYLTIIDAEHGQESRDKWKEVNKLGFTERFSSCLPIYNRALGYSRGFFRDYNEYKLKFRNLQQNKYYVFACYIEDTDEQSQWQFSFNYNVLCLKGQESSETLETRKTELQILSEGNNLAVENYIWKTSDTHMLTKYIRVCVVFKSNADADDFIVSARNFQQGGAYIYNPIVYESQYDKHEINNPDDECNKYDFMPLCIKDTTIENIPLGDNLIAYADCFIPLPYYELLSDY